MFILGELFLYVHYITPINTALSVLDHAPVAEVLTFSTAMKGTKFTLCNPFLYRSGKQDIVLQTNWDLEAKSYWKKLHTLCDGYTIMVHDLLQIN